MAKKKGNSAVVIILLLVITIMGICFYLMYNGTIKVKGDIVDNCVHEKGITENVNSDVIKKSYNDFEGYYTEVVSSEEGWKKEQNGFDLYLYDNGVFRYNMSSSVPFGYQGYYLIDGNTLKLYYLFSYNSGAGLTIAEGSRIMTIDEEGILVDKDKKEVGDETKIVYFSKTESSDIQEFNEYKDITSQLNNSIISNKVGATVPSSSLN